MHRNSLFRQIPTERLYRYPLLRNRKNLAAPNNLKIFTLVEQNHSIVKNHIPIEQSAIYLQIIDK